MCDCNHLIPGDLSRRGFLSRVALGAGAALFSTFAPRAVLAGGHAEALLLSCMDYRLLDDIGRYMAGRGLTDNYDHVVLAGASLGVLQDKNLAWGRTFWEHVDVAISLHRIQKVIVMDHRDCGAYKVFLGPEASKDPQTEFATHAAKLRALRKAVKAKYPALEVELLLMSLDGSVEAVA
jgi:carbonic anhydrase